MINDFSLQLLDLITPDDCSYDGQVRLFNSYNISDTGAIGGVIEICINGIYTSVCGNSLVNTDNLTNIACKSLGYTSQCKFKYC